MSKVAIQGNASGTATFTVAAPVGTGVDRTLTLPDEAGTVITSATSEYTVATNPDYVSVVFPSGSNAIPSDIDATSDFATYLTNNLTVSGFEVAQSGGDIFSLHYSHQAISGITSGVYEFNVFFSMDRNSNSSRIQIAIFLEEDSTKVAYNYDETTLQGYGGCAFSVIRDYTSSVPSSIKIGFESDKSNYLVPKGSGYTVKRIA